MPKHHAHLLPTTILLILAALSCGSATARAQEATPATASAKSEPTGAGDREPTAADRPARARDDAAFFTGAGRGANDLPRPALFGDKLPARAPSDPEPPGDADSATPPPPQTQPAAPAAYTPLTPDEKMRYAGKKAFLSPGGYARVAITSAITQWNEDTQPQKSTEDEVADGASRFAINFGRRATRVLLGDGVFPVLFRQDPRYERAEDGKGFASRAGHAVSRVFVTRGDSGSLQPNVSSWAGSLSSSALSNIWERSTPRHDRIGTDATFKRFANSFVNDAINNVVREFWPDIKKIFKR